MVGRSRGGAKRWRKAGGGVCHPTRRRKKNGMMGDCWVQRPSGPARLIRPKERREFLFELNRIFEFTRALKLCTKIFRRNFDVGIFPKLF
jgi:hypothetical protein